MRTTKVRKRRVRCERSLSDRTKLTCVLDFSTLLCLLSFPTFVFPLVLYLILYSGILYNQSMNGNDISLKPSFQPLLLFHSKSAAGEQKYWNNSEDIETNRLSSHTLVPVGSESVRGRRIGITQQIFNLSGSSSKSLSLPYKIRDLSYTSHCRNQPIYLTMARVKSQLYWELVENFFGTMKKFGHGSCALMICISDPYCVYLCGLHKFNCYDYVHHDSSAHTMEQVATVKLLYVGIALELGAHIFLLDLDVGFLRDPDILIQGFFENDHEQIRSQMDVGYSHRKHEARTQYTHPRPNFGCFLVKSHVMAVMAFRRAWQAYLNTPSQKKSNVATDQNMISVALKWARWRWDMNFSYFYLGFDLDTRPRPIIPAKMVLLDKIDDISKKGIHHELGGKIAFRELNTSVGVHSTCYESSTKLLALKASNAYWNQNYYLPNRRTITKPVLYVNHEKFRDEMSVLAYIAFKTNRTMVVPNIFLGYDENMTKSSYCDLSSDSLKERSFFCKYFSNRNLNVAHAAYQDGGYYWPSFRSISASIGNAINVVEPGYYYKMEMDLELSVPQPQIFLVNSSSLIGDNKLDTLVDILLESDINVRADRVVIGLTDGTDGNAGEMTEKWYQQWARSGSSSWGDPNVDGKINLNAYVPLPSLKSLDEIPRMIDNNIQLCRTFIRKVTTKSSCFSKCRALNMRRIR